MRGRTVEEAERAGWRCEYCRRPEAGPFAGCEIGHTISRKQGGLTRSDKPALSGERCNRAKGTDVGSVSGETRQLVRLFSPRIDRWRDHFRLEGPSIEPLTDIGEVTARLLRFNAPDRLLQRSCLQRISAYPAQ